MSQLSLPPCSRPWITRAEKRRLPLFERMAKGKSISPSYVPMPDIAGKGMYFATRFFVLLHRLILEWRSALLTHNAYEGFVYRRASLLRTLR